MGTIVSTIFNSEDPSQEIPKKSSYNKIFSTLDKISNTLNETEEMIKEIEESLKNPEIDIMEWDYYDFPIMETKKMPAFDY